MSEFLMANWGWILLYLAVGFTFWLAAAMVVSKEKKIGVGEATMTLILFLFFWPCVLAAGFLVDGV